MSNENPRVRCMVTCRSRREFIANYYAGSEKGYVMDLLYDYEFSFIKDARTPERESFWKYTPGGNFSVQSVTQDQFVVGKDYYVDIFPVPLDN